MQISVNKLYKTLVQIYDFDNGWLFPQKGRNGKYYEEFLNDTKGILDDNDDLMIIFDMFQDISRWHLDYTYYNIIIHNKLLSAKDEFIKSTAYAYLCMETLDKSWGCLFDDELINMDIVVRYMAQLFIVSWWEEGDKVVEIILKSIHYGSKDNNSDTIHKIIAEGFKLSRASWFVFELYCQIENYTFNKKSKYYPNNMYPYDKILKEWNTNNLSNVNILISLLGDIHIEQTQESKNNDVYYEFTDTVSWLFPYEILTWLKLRERAGLKNPKTFTHPLMNTPIVKMFLDIKEPLPYPTELPYAKELLEKLKEQCPDVEIPEWLDGKVEETVTSKKEDTDIIPDDFMK